MKQKGLFMRVVVSQAHSSQAASADGPATQSRVMANQQPCRAKGRGIPESAEIAETANIMV
jgi:hypothetical protein